MWTEEFLHGVTPRLRGIFFIRKDCFHEELEMQNNKLESVARQSKCITCVLHKIMKNALTDYQALDSL